MSAPPTVRQQIERLLALVRHAGRFWKTGAVVFVLGCVVAVGVAVTRPRVYRSEALILYRERVAASALGRDEGGDPARRIGLRLRELVLSRSRLEKILSETGLYRDLVEDRGPAEAVDLMRQKVNFRSREGDTYALSFEGEDPQKVQQVTQKLTDALLSETERSQVELAAGTKEFLDSEFERVEGELKKREERLAKFLSEHPAFATEAARGGNAGGTITGVTGVDPKKAAAPRRRSSDPRIEALEREAERIQARLQPAPPPPPQGLPPEAKEAAEEWGRKKTEATRELEAAQRDLKDKRQSFTDEHPDVKRAKGRYDAALRALDEIQLQSMRELARLQGRPPVAVQPLTVEERQRLGTDLQRIQQDIGRFRAAARKDGEPEKDKDASSEADTIVKLETTYVQLSREVSESQEQRRQVEAKRFTAEIRDRLAQTERGAHMVVIDRPYKPTRPTRGGRSQTAGIGGAAAVLLALLVMLTRALLDDRVYAAIDVDMLDLVPVLTAVPPPDSQTQRQMRRELQVVRERHRALPPMDPDRAPDKKVDHG